MPIVNMRTGDIESALALINKEGWNYSREELDRMLRLDPDGSFLYVDGEILGVATAVTYGRTGVIGHLVVSGHARGRKIGQSIFKKAVDYCESAGADSILVYSTEDGKKIYSKFGFRESRTAYCTVKRFSKGDYPRPGSLCLPLSDSDLDQIFALDAEYFGDDRRKLLRLLHSEFPRYCVKLEHEGRVVGFAMGRSSGGTYDLGPVVCITQSKEDVESLFRTVLKSFGSGTVYVGGFPQNKIAVDFLSTLKHEREWTTTVMTKGKERYPAGTGNAYAIAAFEFG